MNTTNPGELRYVGTCSEMGDVYERAPAIPNPGAYAEHLRVSTDVIPMADRTHTMTEPDGLTIARAAELVAEHLASAKPRRHWRITKASQEGRIAQLESLVERWAESHNDASVMAVKQRDRADRWKLIAQCLGLGCLLLIAAGWL